MAKRTERPGGNTPPTKKTKDIFQSLPGSKCLHCDQDCTLESKALQCDLCQNWVHSECEGMSSESYKKLNDICADVVNVSYYCELNNCSSRIKQLVANWKITQSVSQTDTETNTAVKSLLSKYDSLTKSVNELSTKIANLAANNENLQMEINSVSESSTASNQTNVVSNISTPSATATLTILDELADRERRSKNLIVYNLAESSESHSDDSLLRNLFSSVFKVDVVLTRTARLGRRNDSKPSPLLACFADVSVRNMILSYSGKLRKFDQYKNVYIAPDRTKLERQKHQKLVEDLKQRRSNGERNLVIRNGSIVVLTRRPPQTPVSPRHS